MITVSPLPSPWGTRSGAPSGCFETTVIRHCKRLTIANNAREQLQHWTVVRGMRMWPHSLSKHLTALRRQQRCRAKGRFTSLVGGGARPRQITRLRLARGENSRGVSSRSLPLAVGRLRSPAGDRNRRTGAGRSGAPTSASR